MPLQHSISATPVINIYLKQSLVSAGRHQTHVSSIFSRAFRTPAMAARLSAAGTLPCFINKPPCTWTSLPCLPLRQWAWGLGHAVLCARSRAYRWPGSSLHCTSQTSKVKLISLGTVWHRWLRLDPHKRSFSPEG